MPEGNSKQEQDRELEEMNYAPSEDIFNQEEHIPVDGNGNPVSEKQAEKERLSEGLDVPGSKQDDDQAIIGSPDEENNYYSLSDNKDNHEEVNDALIN